MSFNIRHGCGREKWGNASGAFFKGCEKNLDSIILAIGSADPDVVGLQEVSSSQAREIASALNMNYTYSAHNSTGYGHWWGNAVLSRFQILESQTTAIGGSAGRNRSIVTAIALVKGTPTAFISVHTDHRLADERSVKKILRHIDTMSRPTVLIGDFNMLPLDPRASLINQKADFIDSAVLAKPGQMMGTWDSPSGMRIDYIFVQLKYFKVLDAALVAYEHHDASDHIAYYTKIKWKQ
jgi:endonuclease/exonuclease/phosphatase family metal-dependent hydrolase